MFPQVFLATCFALHFWPSNLFCAAVLLFNPCNLFCTCFWSSQLVLHCTFVYATGLHCAFAFATCFAPHFCHWNLLCWFTPATYSALFFRLCNLSCVAYLSLKLVLHCTFAIATCSALYSRFFNLFCAALMSSKLVLYCTLVFATCSAPRFCHCSLFCSALLALPLDLFSTFVITIIFSRGHATLELAVSVGLSVMTYFWIASGFDISAPA